MVQALLVSHQLVTRKFPIGGPDSSMHELSHIYGGKDGQSAHQLQKIIELFSFVPFKKHSLLNFSFECSLFLCGSKICNPDALTARMIKLKSLWYKNEKEAEKIHFVKEDLKAVCVQLLCPG